MKLLTYILIIVFPLTLLAHKASNEEIDKLKEQVDSARQQLRTVKSKYDACDKEKLSEDLRKRNPEDRRELIKTCEQSSDPEIITVLENLNNVRQKLEAYTENNSIEYEAKKVAFAKYQRLAANAASKKGKDDPKVAEAYEEYEMAVYLWQLVHSELTNKFWSARTKFYDACKKSTDPKVVKAIKKLKSKLSRCEIIREDYQDARVELKEALAAYNKTVHSDTNVAPKGGGREQSKPSGSTTAGSGAVK